MIEHGYEWHATSNGRSRPRITGSGATGSGALPDSFWNFMYFRSGLYGEQSSATCSFPGANRFFITTLPDLIARPTDVIDDLCAFLGVSPMGIEAFPRDGTSKGVRSPCSRTSSDGSFGQRNVVAYPHRCHPAGGHQMEPRHPADAAA